jgi:hypothetical protein
MKSKNYMPLFERQVFEVMVETWVKNGAAHYGHITYGYIIKTLKKYGIKADSVEALVKYYENKS